MSLEIKDYVGQIVISSDSFASDRDRSIALELYKRHNLQSVLESVSEITVSSTNDTLTRAHGKSVRSRDYLRCLSVLIKEACPEWISDFVHGFNDDTTRPLCIGCLKRVLKYSSVQPIVEEHCDYDNSHFKQVSEKGYLSLNIFYTLFTKTVLLELTDCNRFSSQICFFCLHLITRHTEHSLWTDSDTCDLATDCLGSLVQFFGCSSFGDLLVLDTNNNLSVNTSAKSSHFYKLITEWQPCLLKSTWKQYPIVAAAFSWCCQCLKFPHLSYFLEHLLPPSLLFVDNFMLENKVRGVQCLKKIIENTSAEELRWYGRADVIYEALKQQLYTTEEELISVLHPTLLAILNVVVKRDSNLSTVTKYDEILQIVLHNAAHENKLALRRVQTEFLHMYIEKMGIGVVKHLKKIVALTEEYLEVSDAPAEQSRLNMLKSLKVLILTAWPRITSHCFTLVKSLVKLIHDVSVDDQNTQVDIRDSVIAVAAECLSLLQAVDKDKITDLLTPLRNVPLSTQCRNVIEQLINNTS